MSITSCSLLDQYNLSSITVLKFSEQADFKTDLTFWIWIRFEVVIAKKQNKEIVCYTLYVDIVDIYSKF